MHLQKLIKDLYLSIYQGIVLLMPFPLFLRQKLCISFRAFIKIQFFLRPHVLSHIPPVFYPFPVKLRSFIFFHFICILAECQLKPEI